MEPKQSDTMRAETSQTGAEPKAPSRSQERRLDVQRKPRPEKVKTRAAVIAEKRAKIVTHGRAQRRRGV